MGFNIGQFFKDWGSNPLVVVIIGALLGAAITLITVFFRHIGRLLGRILTWIWDEIRGRGADHDFEKLYLDWLIREHRHLGLLPAQIIAIRWKDRQQLVRLEDVFIKLYGGPKSQVHPHIA
jgi:hypothetical protein